MRTRLLFAGAAMIVAAGCSGDDNSSNGTTPGQDGGGGGGHDGGTSNVDGGGTTNDSGSMPKTDGATMSGDTGSPIPTVGGIFEQPEPWTKDVSGLLPDARSGAIIMALDALGGWGGGKLQIDFSIPVFFADTSTPREMISGASGYCYGGPDCDAVPLPMPIPANGNAEGSNDYTCDVTYNTNGQGDCHVLVVEQTEKKLYELYNSTANGNGGITALGAFVWDLTKAYPDNERGDQCTSADAAGFPIAGLLATADEVAAGEVKHAIRFILPNNHMKNKAYVHPASHAGSPNSANADAPPYGVRFRLNAMFDETPFNAGEKVIIHALKKYGMLLSDGGTIALTFADDRTTTAKWAGQGITAQSFGAIKVDDFEVVDLSPEIASTQDCVRN